MVDRAVRVSSIDIRRILGIRPEMGFGLSNLSPGINLIHGPNGSGKSTVARALQELLWPGRTDLERPSITGRFKDGDSDWSVSIDAGHVEATCDGRSESLPEVGPAENRSRYHLALHELINANNRAFAKQIADESQGGYDLEEAARDLKFSDRPSVPRKLTEDLKKAQKHIRESESKQNEAQRDEDSIPTLRAEHSEAITAANQIGVLRKAIEHAEARKALSEIEIKLEALPTQVAGLKGDERVKLNALDGRGAVLEKDRKTEQDRTAEAERELSELNLGPDGIEIGTIAPLETHQRRLKDIETERARHEQNLAKAQTEAEKARARLGEHITDDQLSRLEQVEIGELTRFAKQADQVWAKKQILHERRLDLEKNVQPDLDAHTGEKVREGITALSQWLSSASPGKRAEAKANWISVVGGALAFFLGLVLVAVHHWAWLSAVLAAAGLMVISRRRRDRASDKAAADPRAVHRKSFVDTGLEPPESWEILSVTAHLRSLVDLLVKRAAEDERQQKLDALQREETELASKEDDLEQARREILNRIGLEIEIGDAWLPLLIDNIGYWQSRSSEAASCRSVLDGFDVERNDLIEKLNTGLAVFGYDPIEMAETVARYIEDLKNRQARHQTATRTKKDAAARLANTIEPGIVAVADERLDVFRNAGLAPKDEPSLDDWSAKHGEYLGLKTEHTTSMAVLKDRRQALEGHEKLLLSDPQDMLNQIAQLESVAQKRDDLSARIAVIKEKISELKAGHDFSEALAESAAAEDALARARDLGNGAVVGSRLTSWVRTIAIDRSRPQVFRRAADLVARFSRGSLDLEFDDQASPPEFRVCRGTSPAASVETLSVGERVQLLTAIRIAFLETNEQTRLPLLLDETLGTSDDSRAGLIIDRIIEIAREGRQVFYFTAQNDEVGKWQARLADCGVPNACFDLARIRHEAVAASTPLELVSVTVKEPIAPQDMSHSEYGRQLPAPGLDPTIESLDNLHLWHLIEDVDLLYGLLLNQIKTWGQLKTLLKHGGGGLVETDDPQYRRAFMTAKVIETACEAWRIGRGKGVDREVLLQSGCITDNFMDALVDLTNRVDNKAEAVIRALDAGEIKRWRQANTEKLQSFFESQGYLTTDEPLQISDIRVRVMAAVAYDLRADRIPKDTVDRILGALSSWSCEE